MISWIECSDSIPRIFSVVVGTGVSPSQGNGCQKRSGECLLELFAAPRLH